MELLKLGLETYGNKTSDGLYKFNWFLIQKRFVPAHSIESIRVKVHVLRTFDSNFAKYRSRSVKRTMTKNEMCLLINGIQKYGFKAWKIISDELLPNWNRIELRKFYFRKVKPLQEQGKLPAFDLNLNPNIYLESDIDTIDNNDNNHKNDKKNHKNSKNTKNNDNDSNNNNNDITVNVDVNVNENNIKSNKKNKNHNVNNKNRELKNNDGLLFVFLFVLL